MKVIKIVFGNTYYLTDRFWSTFAMTNNDWTGIEDNGKVFTNSEAVAIMQQLNYNYPNDLYEVK